MAKLGTPTTSTSVGSTASTLSSVGSTNTPKSISSPWAIGILSATGGISAGLQALTQRKVYSAQASTLEAQAGMYDINADLAGKALENAYITGNYQAMVQGLSDAQTISKTRTQAAGRGVLLNSGSTAEVEASQRINAKINQINIQRNTTAKANQARMQQANFRAQAIVARGQAQAYRELASATNPFLTGLFTGLMSVGMMDLQSQMQGNYSIFTSKGWSS